MGLEGLSGQLSTRSLQIARNALERALRFAQVHERVGRNVAELIEAPKGRAGRPSKSLSLAQAQELLTAADGSRWYGYIVLSLLSGLRTEEVRALRWDHVVTWVDDATGWQPVTEMSMPHTRSRYSGSSLTSCTRAHLSPSADCQPASWHRPGSRGRAEETDPRARSNNERPLSNRLPASGCPAASTAPIEKRRHGRYHPPFSR